MTKFSKKYTKDDFIKVTSDKFDLTKKDVLERIDFLAKAIKEFAMDEMEVDTVLDIREFLRIEKKVQSERIARNPKTGEQVTVPAKVKYVTNIKVEKK